MQKQWKLNIRDLKEFEEYLEERESFRATRKKYMTDIKTFYRYLDGESCIDKGRLMEYREWLLENYAVSSANSMLAALNRYLDFIGAGRIRMKRIRVQSGNFEKRKPEMKKEEYQRLVDTAAAEGRGQLALLIETICAIGIRVGELKFFTVDSVRKGAVKVWNKGKYRTVLVPDILRKKLMYFIKKNEITQGAVFRTKKGKAKDRSNIWREMKELADRAGVDGEKVFPHNLRHLFSRTFYRMTRDLVNLADILGHSSIETTRIYTTDEKDQWKKKIEQLDLVGKTDIT